MAVKQHDEHWWSKWAPYDGRRHYRHCLIKGCDAIEYKEVS